MQRVPGPRHRGPRSGREWAQPFKRLAPSCIAKGLARLRQTRRTQRNDHSPKCCSWQSMDVVKVDDAIRRHTVILCGEFQFRDEPSDSPRQRGDHDMADPIRDGIPRQHENRSIATRRRSEPNLTPLHQTSPTNPPPDPTPRSKRVPSRSRRSAPRRTRPSHARPQVAQDAGARLLATAPTCRSPTS